jgi:hypothetical protein
LAVLASAIVLVAASVAVALYDESQYRLQTTEAANVQARWRRRWRNRSRLKPTSPGLRRRRPGTRLRLLGSALSRSKALNEARG